jgi:hypothetical protein
LVYLPAYLSAVGPTGLPQNAFRNAPIQGAQRAYVVRFLEESALRGKIVHRTESYPAPLRKTAQQSSKSRHVAVKSIMISMPQHFLKQAVPETTVIVPARQSEQIGMCARMRLGSRTL